jgi:hypothetical protein
VFQAQRDLATAKNTELLATLNYRKSLVDLQRLQETPSSGGSSVTNVSTGSGATTTGSGRTATSSSSGG